MVRLSSILLNVVKNPETYDRIKRLYPSAKQEFTDEGFPVLKLKPSGRNVFAERTKRYARRSYIQYKNREEQMKETQDWPSVWPTAKTFVPSAVPLPIRQSYEHKPGKVPRGKYLNTELLKITNFLHLSPDAVRRQCLAIKKFTTEWPEQLQDDETIRQVFPVTFVTRDYVHSAPTIRDARARIIELRIHVRDLKLNERDEEKLIELARERYNPETDLLTIKVDACPMKGQNIDYSEYLLSALYFESQEHQEWEDEKVDEDAIYKVDLDEYRKEVEKKLGL